MSELVVNAIDLPKEVRECLASIDRNIDINSYDTKASNGYVFFGKNKITNQDVVVKFYYWGGKSVYHAEPQLLTEVDSPNVLKVIDAGFAGPDWAYFLTPMCPGGDLDSIVLGNDASNRRAVRLTEHVLQGLSHLHGKRLLHRDLKPANIFIADGDVGVIGDFGSLRRAPQSTDYVPASSHAILYRPPEAIGGAGKFGYASDIYQVGMVLFQLLGGPLPYDQKAWLSAKQLKTMNEFVDETDAWIYGDRCIEERILKGKIVDVSDLPPWVPKSLLKIVNKATNLKPESRYKTVADFIVALNHILPSIPDWCLKGGVLYLNARTEFMISDIDGKLIVKKRRGGGVWRRDNSYGSNPKLEAIIEKMGSIA